MTCPFCDTHADGECYAHYLQRHGRKVHIKYVATDPEKSRQEIFEAQEAFRHIYVPALRNKSRAAE